MFDSDELKNRLDGILDDIKDQKGNPAADAVGKMLHDLLKPGSPEFLKMTKDIVLKGCATLLNHYLKTGKKLQPGMIVEIFDNPTEERGSIGEMELIHNCHENIGGVALQNLGEDDQSVDVPMLETWIAKDKKGETHKVRIRISKRD